MQDTPQQVPLRKPVQPSDAGRYFGNNAKLIELGAAFATLQRVVLPDSKKRQRTQKAVLQMVGTAIVLARVLAPRPPSNPDFDPPELGSSDQEMQEAKKFVALAMQDETAPCAYCEQPSGAEYRYSAAQEDDNIGGLAYHCSMNSVKETLPLYFVPFACASSAVAMTGEGAGPTSSETVLANGTASTEGGQDPGVCTRRKRCNSSGSTNTPKPEASSLATSSPERFLPTAQEYVPEIELPASSGNGGLAPQSNVWKAETEDICIEYLFGRNMTQKSKHLFLHDDEFTKQFTKHIYRPNCTLLQNSRYLRIKQSTGDTLYLHRISRSFAECSKRIENGTSTSAILPNCRKGYANLSNHAFEDLCKRVGITAECRNRLIEHLQDPTSTSHKDKPQELLCPTNYEAGRNDGSVERRRWKIS